MSVETVVGVLLLMIVGFAIGVHLSALARVVLDAVASILRILQEPFNLVLTAVDNALGGLTVRLRTVLPSELPWVRRVIVVAVAMFCAVVAIGLFWCDYGLMQLTLEAMGFTTGQGVGASPDRLMALSLGLSAAFWAIVLLDVLGLRHLDWVDHRLEDAPAATAAIGETVAQPTPREASRRRALGSLSLIGLALALAIGGALGLRRAQSVSSVAADDAAMLSFSDSTGVTSAVDTGAFGSASSLSAVGSAAPEPGLSVATGPNWADLFVGVGLPVLLTVTSSFAAVGLFQAVAYLAAACLAVLSLILAILRLALNIVVNILNIIYGLVEALFGLVASAMVGIWNWLAEIGFLQKLRLRAVPFSWPPPNPGAATAADDTGEVGPGQAPIVDPPLPPHQDEPEPPAPPADALGTASFNPLGI